MRNTDNPRHAKTYKTDVTKKEAHSILKCTGEWSTVPIISSKDRDSFFCCQRPEQKTKLTA